ncbi:MAG: YbaN family protein [Rikenellaceae bacterium]
MKLLFIALGSLSLALGLLGIILPVLPTTPFLLLSATLYMHSSPRLYDWLLHHRFFGSYIRNYRENKVIPIKVKIIAMITLWSTILFSIFTIGPDRLYIQLLLLVVAIGVSWHILSHRSRVE